MLKIFKIMKQTFTYQKKFSYSYCYPFIAFAVLAIICKYYNYGLAFKRLTFLQYPNSFYLMIVCAILFLGYAIYKYISASKSSKNDHPIEVDETEFSFPKGTNEKVTIKFDDVTELWNKKDKDYGMQVIIYTNKNRYEFSEDHFASPDDFNQFNNLMTKYCTKITNR